MALLIKNFYAADYRKFIRDVSAETQTVPDLNVSVETLLRDFTRDPRDFEWEQEPPAILMEDPCTLPGTNYPSIDPLTDRYDVEEQARQTHQALSETRDATNVTRENAKMPE